MDGSAREAVPSATEKPNNEDYEDDEYEDTAVKDGRTSKITELLEPFCLLGGTTISCGMWMSQLKMNKPKFAGFLSVYSDVG